MDVSPTWKEVIKAFSYFMTFRHTFERNIVLIRGSCWNFDRINIRSACPTPPWMNSLPKRRAYACKQSENHVDEFSINLYLQCKYIVRKNNDLVTTIFMVFYQKLAWLEFVGVHAVQQHTLAWLFLEIFTVELGCHRTPYLSTLWTRWVAYYNWERETHLNIRNMAFGSQIPIIKWEVRTIER